MTVKICQVVFIIRKKSKELSGGMKSIKCRWGGGLGEGEGRQKGQRGRVRDLIIIFSVSFDVWVFY